ncbi:sensor domain-containing diguanylate cyclase [Longivirga aurantiaca]|uniref:Diguanylate cyclase domain-containing protein n=1 Tax=Longivirga aurantiaca TaxID=1837743 RepID=A0ABW1SXZ9_9ACTN
MSEGDGVAVGDGTAAAALLRAMVRDVPTAVLVTDLEGKVLLANRSARRLIGRPGHVSLVEGVHADDAHRLRAYIAMLAGDATHRSVHLAELQVRWGDVERVVAVDGRRIKGLPGFRGLVFSLQDVSQYVEELQSLRRSAYVDALTGLPNRAAMWNAIQQAFRTRQNGSVLMVDLDDFKGINDRFGHAAGDQVLTTVAGRLRRAVHEIGTVARFGGDEFVILLPAGGEDDARRVMNLVVHEVGRPIPVGLDDLVVGVSVGGAVLGGRHPDDALRRADEALYRAKSSGRGQTCLWSDDDEEWRVRRADVRHELDRLRKALEAERQKARTDVGTGLPNTRRLLEDLRALCDPARPQPVGLVFIDLDHFGAVNKTHGDTAGDDVLRQVADVFRGACRGMDTVYRKGGEEFVVVLPGADHDQAVRVGERFRRRLVENGITHGGLEDMPFVTLSAGVATAELVDDGSVDELMRIAAMRMLTAKQSGRNRVVSEGGAST